jgi:dihydroxyacetone kinase DhaKLM complex PTS-EIIA-like component DhaM
MKFFKPFFVFVLCTVIVFISMPVQAGQVELSWTAPATPPEFDKYRIYWGEETGNYTQHQEVDRGTTSVTISNLTNKKSYYFAATTVAASGQESEYSNEVSAYLDVDTDMDGILDQEELNVYGTDPNRADTDGDGINDGDELAFWKDQWNQDADGDGLINLLDRDADGDGIADGSDMSDGTAPPDQNPLPDPEPALELLPVVSVEASGAQDPNVPANTTDGDLNTRWSAEGDGQWIMYDIGTLATVNEVAIVWFNGDQRQASFAIDTSVDGTTWKAVFSGDSSGTMKDFEAYTFPAVAARYVRITGYGNSANPWNSINETEVYGQLSIVPLPISDVYASDAQTPNVAANTIDGNMQTRWSAEGDGQWIVYDVGVVSTVSEVAIAWLNGDQRQASFAIEASIDGKAWKAVLSGDSSGATKDFEVYTFPSVAARYVRITGYGNSANPWNSINETEIYGQLNAIWLPVVSVEASGAQDPNVPANTTDGDLNTRWSAEGDGQWIMYDIGTLATVNEVAIAWFNGDQRQASFAIDTSVDGKAWKAVLSGDSSGATKDFEAYAFPSVAARYVRITGYGNSANPWNSINEIKLYGPLN